MVGSASGPALNEGHPSETGLWKSLGNSQNIIKTGYEQAGERNYTSSALSGLAPIRKNRLRRAGQS